MSQKLKCDLEAMLADTHGLAAMMARVPTDMRRVLDEKGIRKLADAVARCRRCYETAACDIWMDQHHEGEGAAAPGFCPVRDYLSACAPSLAGSELTE